MLGKCDALDGTADGLVQDTGACQKAFDLNRDVPTCSGARDGTCLSAAQKTGIAGLFSGAKTESGAPIYASFPWDAGLATGGWASWKFNASLNLDTGAAAFIWSVPPADRASFNGPAFALNAKLDALLASIKATSSTYPENALSFMTPPNPSKLGTLKNRGAKMMVYHGTSDPIFSSGQAPDSVTASVRGTGNAGGVNADLPSGWSAARTRPLCAYPKVARYKDSGSVEDAASFSCQ